MAVTVVEKTSSNILSPALKSEFDKKLSYFDDIKDMETRDYLKVKCAEIFVKGADYALHAGRIGQEVFEELGRKGSPEGLYTRWVEFSGFSESTMKRYRNRWEVFSAVKENVKPFILLLSHQEINKILKDEEIKEVVYSTEEVTYDDLKNLITEENKKSSIPKQPQEIKFSDFDRKKFEDFLNKADGLEPAKKQKVYKLLAEITKLMDI